MSNFVMIDFGGTHLSEPTLCKHITTQFLKHNINLSMEQTLQHDCYIRVFDFSIIPLVKWLVSFESTMDWKSTPYNM